MRVNPYPIPDLLAALNETQLQAQRASLEISTGRSVNVPSDNPTAAALLVENNDEFTFTNGYLQSITAVQGQLSTADSTLGSITSALQQALSLGVEAGGGTLSTAGLTAIATQLQEIQGQILSLTNTAYQGHYIFAGTDTNTAPFRLDNTSLSGVSYAGNTDVNQVSIGSGYKLAINVPGSQLFSAPGSDMFLAINNLIQAVQTNTGIPAAVNAISAVSSYLSQQRVFYGNATDQTQSQSNYLTSAKLQITEQQSSLGGADVAVAATNLAQANTDTQAALEAIAKMSQNNLFNYLP
jgi:flagellar hook-associated protein 3 FlgL